MNLAKSLMWPNELVFDRETIIGFFDVPACWTKSKEKGYLEGGLSMSTIFSSAQKVYYHFKFATHLGSFVFELYPVF